MGKHYTDGLLMPDTFIPTGAQPLDNRSVVDTVSDLYTVFGTALYNGMTVYVISEKSIYVLVDYNRRTEAAGWKKLGSDVGGTNADWNETDPTSYAYIFNKPNVEVIGNKVNVLDETCTISQYPTAYIVYEKFAYLNDKIGDMLDILNTI